MQTSSGCQGAAIGTPPRHRAGTGLAGLVALALPLTGAAMLTGPTAAAAAAGSVPNSCVATDNGLPRVEGATFSPTAVDTTTTAQRVTLTMTVRDTGGPGRSSGVAGVQARVAAPSPPGERPGFWRPTTLRLQHAAGDQWRGTFVVPRHAPPGQWRVTWVQALDRAGNEYALAENEVDAVLSGPGLEVTSVADRAKPALTAVQVTPRKRNTTRKPKKARVTVTASDAGSGVASVSVTLKRPGGQQVLDLNRRGATFTKRFKIPRWAGTGTWRVKTVVVRDAVGNQRFQRRAAVKRLGARPIKVTSLKDRGAPRLGAVTIRPTKVNTRKKNRAVKVKVRLRDAKSGVRSATVSLGGQLATLKRTKGTRRDGLWKGKLKLRTCQELVKRPRALVSAYDRAGNELEALSVRITAKSADRTIRPPQVRPRQTAAGGPITLRFAEPVTGIGAASAQVRAAAPSYPWWGAVVAGSWRCQNAAGRTVSCATGKVRTAAWTPASPVDPHRAHQVELNPEGNLGVVDLAGNAYRRTTVETRAVR